MAKKRPLPKSQSPSWVESAFYVLIVIAFAAGLLAGYLVWGVPNQAPQPQAAAPQAAAPQAAANQPTAEPKRYDVDTDDDPAIGPETAPITIIEFSDYQCPYCRRWAQQVEGKLLETYGDKIRLVYRDFPLTRIHAHAFAAAEAANCAGEQGKYWEYHDALFSGKYELGDDAFAAYAKELGLDTDQFAQCMKEHRYRDEVQGDLDYALALGVQSTPTFFINGIAVVGAQPFEVFASIIEQELDSK